MSKWISVKDRIPESEEKVLWWAPFEHDKKPVIGQWTTLCVERLIKHGLLTHWMPLPEPPEDEV